MLPSDVDCPACGSDILAVQGMRDDGRWIVRLVCRSCLAMWTPDDVGVDPSAPEHPAPAARAV